VIPLGYIFLEKFFSAFNKSLLVFCCLALVISCGADKKETESKERPVARVNDKFLYPSDLLNLVPKDISSQDSTAFIKNYIEKWIQDELVLKNAEENLTSEQLNVEKQLAEYRKNLIIFNYNSELIRQKLDTGVTATDIENYYNQHKESFTLKDNIVKVWYVKINQKAPNVEKIKNWYKSDNPKDFISLKTYCLQFADNFFLDESNWILFDELLKEIPVSSLNPDYFLRTNKYIEVADSAFLYYVNIKSYKIKNTLSPLAFEKANIRNIIINKRKLDLIEEMKSSVLENGKGNFEIFDVPVKK
jgi:hypothetical protein